MSKEKPSFFERLTGAVRINTNKDNEAEEISTKRHSDELAEAWTDKETEQEGELTVDMYQNSDMVIIKSMIAGVHPEDLDISITRDVVTIRGKREEERIVEENDFIVKELYWGSFSRTLTLPAEIDVDEAEAVEKHGLLILKLPKLDKKRKSKLKVKTA